METLARKARAAALELSALDIGARNGALGAVREALVRSREAIFEANRRDREEAESEVEAGRLSKSLAKRLDIEGRDGEKFEAVLAGLDDLIRLPDPVGRVSYAMRLDDGLELERVSCPIGVLGVIFEARPDAAIQISALAIKSANALILKGGREADRTNRALIAAVEEGLRARGFPSGAVALISTREDVKAMLALDRYIDLIIPRGSNDLVRSIQASTRIPVMGHADGLCAVYIDRAADPEKAAAVVVDSKAQYPAACNAAETLLVHRDAIRAVLPAVGKRLREAGVALRADPECLAVLPGAAPAQEEDFRTEFLDLIMAVKAVGSLEDAVDHINTHGSHHTDAIVTEDASAAERFLARVDSAGVFHNASTRFADGFRYGFGAEVGISTARTHARGPVGLEGLVIYKYHLRGSGQGVAAYGPGKKAFLHAPLRLPAPIPERPSPSS
ncbi:MAG TPA: glutamate-5-semialdehyde dehydrogenase [Planctomycetota bacterium]|nr:glutamate-5-semialdehyde dehydrogenase [Planctomycetota bacterium]